MSITIKDVAKAAGVSHTTVSRALRDNPTIAATTTANIKQLAKEMGYVPNHMARSLKMQRSGVLGVIVRRADDPFFGQVLDGIEDVTRGAGYNLFLAASKNDAKKDEDIVAAMVEQRVAGIIVCSTRLSAASQQKLVQLNVPIVLVNNQAMGQAAHEIFHDDTHGTRLLTKHLIELGHIAIAYLGNANAGLSNQQRLLGYQAALTEAGILLQPEYIITVDNGRAKGGAMGVEPLLRLSNRPTAIVCYNDIVALGAIHTLAENDVRVPQDCSITGFDGVPLSAYTLPALTTFHQPTYELGMKSAEMLLSQLSNRDRQNHTIRLRGELIVRKSTAPPPAAKF